MIDTEQFLQEIESNARQFYSAINQATHSLIDFNSRLGQISKQDYKNLDIRDTGFAMEFDSFCKELRQTIDTQLECMAKTRSVSYTKLALDGCSLQVKAIANRARDVQSASQKFSIVYNDFWKKYQGFTAFKISAWVLEACQHDISNLNDKYMVLSRSLLKYV